MREFVQKQNQTQKGNSIDPAKSRKITPKSITDEHPILRLQRTIGNQAVLRMLRSQGILRASTDATADRSEQEAEGNALQGDHIHEVASKGVAGPSAPLPHLDAVQRSFGKHDISSVEAHNDPQATDANQAIDAVGYAIGNHVAFAGTPDLHTAAHEAAHVVQQRSGVQLAGGIGEAGDAYETHADAVAERVVNGKQAGPLLDQTPGYAGRHGESAAGAGAVQKSDQPVQMQGAHKQTQTTQPTQTTGNIGGFDQKGFQKMMEEGSLMYKVKAPMVEKLATAYVSRPGKLETPDVVIPGTPYGGNKVKPGIHEPGYNQVYNALNNAIDMKKIGKGYSATDWEWREAPAKKKTDEQKSTEVEEFAAEEYLQDRAEKDAMKLAERYVEKNAEKALVKTIAEKTAVKTSVEWLTERSLLASATLLVEAAALIEVIGVATLVIGLYELGMSLDAPAELSPYQQMNANIVASVKAWLQGKQEAADREERIKKPMKFEYKTMTPDKTKVSP